MKKYFVDIRFLSSRNNLESQLMEAFRGFENHLISSDNLSKLKDTYQTVLNAYKQNKGRSHVDYSVNKQRGIIYISMGDQISLTLTEVVGEL